MQVRTAYAAVLLALLACVVAWALAQTAFWHGIELDGYDLLVANQPAEPPSQQIVIVDFDELSVQQLKAFPIPRRLLAEVVTKVSAGSPSVIGLDIILDRARDADDDRRLAEAMDAAGNIILVSEYGFGGLSRNEPLPQFVPLPAWVSATCPRMTTALSAGCTCCCANRDTSACHSRWRSLPMPRNGLCARAGAAFFASVRRMFPSPRRSHLPRSLISMTRSSCWKHRRRGIG